MFKASDYVAAQAPWQVELEGVAYTARLISQEQILRYNARVVEAKRAGVLSTDPEIVVAIQTRLAVRSLWWLYRQAFPWRPSMLWRGDPVRRLFRLPPDAFAAARRDFFGSLARADAAKPGTMAPTLSSAS